MPFTSAAPCPHDVVGLPCGKRALKVAAPADESDASAPSACCGSSLPDITAMKVDNASTRPPTSTRPTDHVGNVVDSPSATLLPACGLPIDVTAATRPRRTAAT